MKGSKRLTRQEITEELHAQLKFKHKWSDKVANFLTCRFGTVSFLFLNFLFFAVWIVVNEPWFDSTLIPPFDPFPFGLLTMIVSLEAIFLSIVVLISQNRQSKTSDIRQRVEFELDVRSEEETTKILQMLDELHMHLGIKKKHDDDLVRMERPTDLGKIQRRVERREE